MQDAVDMSGVLNPRYPKMKRIGWIWLNLGISQWLEISRSDFQIGWYIFQCNQAPQISNFSTVCFLQAWWPTQGSQHLVIPFKPIHYTRELSWNLLPEWIFKEFYHPNPPPKKNNIHSVELTLRPGKMVVACCCKIWKTNFRLLFWVSTSFFKCYVGFTEGLLQFGNDSCTKLPLVLLPQNVRFL